MLETNRKQTTCTNLFSMCFCLQRQQFVLAEAVAKFFLEVSNDTQSEMHVQPHIFHLKEKRLKGAKLGSNRSQGQHRKQASDLCFLRFAGAKVGT